VFFQPKTTPTTRRLSLDPLAEKRADPYWTERLWLKHASNSAAGELIFLSRQIETELRRALARLGVLRTHTIKQGFNELARYGLMTDLIETVDLFNKVRTAVVHQSVQPSEAEMASAIDSGLKILKALRDWPAAKHMVTRVDIPLFSEPDLQKPRTDFTGILITDIVGETRAVGTHLLPTRRKEYKPGMEVTLEFDMDSIVGESFYESESGESYKRAFKEAAEFVGRDITSIQ
jgi:hypothetical protein